MFEQLKQSWRRFQLEEPGRRFQARFHQRQKSGHGVLRRLLLTAGGVFLLAIGIFFLAAPGPGLIIIFIGASLLAQESLWLARLLDAAELVLRKIYLRTKPWWRKIFPALKMWLLTGALLLFAALGLGIYQLVFAH